MIEQKTKEWFEARLGKLTASNMDAAMHVTKEGKDYADRHNLKMQILAERLTGKRVEIFVTKPMQHGNEQEPVAKDILKEIGAEFDECGFIEHPEIKNFGASPDGLTKDGGIIEIKCPKTETHLKWMLSGVVPDEHKAQMLAQMICTQREFGDFISFDPRVKNPKLRIFIRRYVPKKEELKKINCAAIKFLNELSELEELLMGAAL